LTPHTRLINCVIGFCKETDNWIHPLSDLGYNACLIEQSIALSQIPGTVKPDVVAYSNRQINAIAFDCKGGTTVNQDQLERYRKLANRDLLNWVDCFNPPQFSHDVCIADFEENHGILSETIKDFPFLVLSQDKLRKSGSFKKDELNSAFSSDISIDKEMVPPVSYYPFSEMDDRGLIVKEVIRAIITILRNPRRRRMVVFDKGTYQNDDILTTIHPLYPILSIEHRNLLTNKIYGIIDHLRREYPKFHDQILAIRERGTDPDVAISNLIETCEEIIKTEEGKFRLDQT
jgi:hypothetical protein